MSDTQLTMLIVTGVCIVMGIVINLIKIEADYRKTERRLDDLEHNLASHVGMLNKRLDRLREKFGWTV